MQPINLFNFKIMLKTIFTSFLTCGLALLGFSQAKVSSEFKTTLGTPYQVIDANDKYYFNKGEEILTIKIDRREAFIQKLNSKTLKFIEKKVFKDFIPDDGKLEEVAEFNGRYFVFYSLWAKPFEQLFCKEIDFAKCEAIGKDRLLLKTDKKITAMGGVTFGFGGFGFVGGGKFSFSLSFDKKKVLIKYRVKPEKKDDNISYDIIGMTVFDDGMIANWGKEVKMPYTEKKMNNLDYTLDGQGNAYILTTVYNDNSTKLELDGKVNFHIELLKIEAKTANIKTTIVDLKDKYINKIWLDEDKSGQIICAGYYSKRVRELEDADGLFMFKLDKEGKVYNIITHEIPVSVLNQYASERTQKRNAKADEKGKADFADLVLRDIILQDDGSVVLIGEQHYVNVITYYTQYGMRTRTEIYYNDILVSKINANGTLAWMQKLGKRQFSAGGSGLSFWGLGINTYRQGGMGFKYMSKNGSHYMLFLDNVKNMELPLNKEPKRHIDGLGGFMTAYKLDDKSGQVSKLSLFDTRDVQGTEVYQFNVDRILSLSGSEFVVEVYKKKKEDVLIKVTLE